MLSMVYVAFAFSTRSAHLHPVIIARGKCLFNMRNAFLVGYLLYIPTHRQHNQGPVFSCAPYNPTVEPEMYYVNLWKPNIGRRCKLHSHSDQRPSTSVDAVLFERYIFHQIMGTSFSGFSCEVKDRTQQCSKLTHRQPSSSILNPPPVVGQVSPSGTSLAIRQRFFPVLASCPFG